MVVAPLVIAVGAVLLLTPKDILRQPVLPDGAVDQAAMTTASTARKPKIGIAVADIAPPEIQPASLVVTAAPLDAAPVAPTATPVDRRWVTASGLNLRVGPSVKTRLIASLPFGTPVEVLETSGSWAHIVGPDGASGWLSANFLTTDDPAAAAD